MAVDPDFAKKRHAKDLYLRRTYGLTIEDFERIHEFQDHACALAWCRKPLAPLEGDVDHDHRTGFVRGILCRYCNHRIVGRIRAEQAESVANYLGYCPAFALGIEAIKPKKKRKPKVRPKPGARKRVTKPA